MSDSRHDHDHGPTMPGRRSVLKAGLVLAAAPLVGGVGGRAEAAPGSAVANGPVTARAYGTTSATAALGPMEARRRAVGPHDVLLDVLYCGICHSDIHQARSEWSSIPTTYPCVPGHEIIGRVQAVGSAVTRFKVGDIGGVGCMVDSCGTCDNCVADREQNCLKGATFTYNSPDRATGENTLGGYSEKMVVSDRFVIRIPPGADLAGMAPLLCAGITTFSPMQHWKLSARQRVGVIGLGGLGHIAVKLAAARKAEVTVFTTSPGKVADARRLGAVEAVLWSDAAAMKRLANRFDLLISTVPQAYPMQPFIGLLALDGTLVNVGALNQLDAGAGFAMIAGRKGLAGSMIGGIAETQEVVDYCAARGIKADVELVRPDQINGAYDRVVSKDVRYRFVIDLTAGRKA
jgi:alcohol dehydrogenase (NADP+)